MVWWLRTVGAVADVTIYDVRAAFAGVAGIRTAVFMSGIAVNGKGGALGTAESVMFGEWNML